MDREDDLSKAPSFTPEEIKTHLLANLIQFAGRDPTTATKRDWFYALAYFLRGRLSAARVADLAAQFRAGQQVELLFVDGAPARQAAADVSEHAGSA